MSKQLLKILTKLKNQAKRNDQEIQISKNILSNLFYSPWKHQSEALKNLFLILNNKKNILNEIEDEELGFTLSDQHYLFHMATGSGKTLVMAASMLMLYEKGFRKFIFTTNSTNLIDKTRNNLLPTLNSNNCEFNKSISINNIFVPINEVNNFTNDQHSIEIMFKTTNYIHNCLTIPKENSIDINFFSKEKVVILADEAHHLQSTTKAKKEEQTWEDTINNILSANKESLLLEFTATMDLDNKNIAKKYENKIISNFSIKEFRVAGLSKEIMLLKMNDVKSRILSSIVFSYFRDLSYSKKGVNCSSKILFKGSGTIEQLKEQQINVLKLIYDLSIEDLQEIINTDIKFMQYVKKEFSNLEEILINIKKIYTEQSCLMLHSADSKKQEKITIANELDNIPGIKMIFAIEMLTEGWNIKSLFDIVKLDNTISNKSTVSEAQLIGRGARFWTYKFNNNLIQQRQFDEDFENMILETMVFYASNDNGYIESIKQTLEKEGYSVLSERNVIPVNINFDLFEKIKDLKLKVNYLSKKLKDNYDFSFNLLIEKDYSIKSVILNKEENSVIGEKRFEFKELFANYKFLLFKKMDEYKTFNFKNIKLTKEEIYNKLYENSSNYIFILKGKEEPSLNEMEELTILFLNEIEKKLDFVIEEIKVSEFEEVPFSSFTFSEEILNNPKRIYVTLKQDICLQNKIYTDSDSEIKFLESFEKQVVDCILIRNDGFWKIYNKEGIGFIPDFISINLKTNLIIPVEIKGEHLVQQENWKKDLIEELGGIFILSEEVKSFDYKVFMK